MAKKKPGSNLEPEPEPEIKEPLLSIPELQKESGVSDFILIAYLSAKGILKKYNEYPDEKIMTLEEFKTDLNNYKRKKIKLKR
jgi:hypothetical protein